MFTVTQVGSWPRSQGAAARPARPPEGAHLAARSSSAVADDEVRRCVQHPARGGRRRRRRRRAPARQLLLLRHREGRRDAADVAGRDARHRRGQGRLRGDARHPRRAGLGHQEPHLRRAGSRGASRWPWTSCASCRSSRTGRSRSRCPGPYLLTRSMWVGAFSQDGLRGQDRDGRRRGAHPARGAARAARTRAATFVQFDEPVLTEIVMSRGLRPPHLHVSDPRDPP